MEISSILIRAKDALSPAALKRIAELKNQGECDKDLSFYVTTTQTNEDKRQNHTFIPTASKKGKTNSTFNTKVSMKNG